MKDIQTRFEGESVQEYFYRMLIEEKVNFAELISQYVRYIEKEKEENRRDIVEANTLLAGVKETTLWAGSKKSYQARVKKFLEKFKLY